MNTIKRLIYHLRGFKPCEKCHGVGTTEGMDKSFAAVRFRCDRCKGTGLRPTKKGDA